MIKHSLLDIENRNILFSPPDITEAEIEEVIDTMKSGWITTGPRTKEFERRIADYVGVNKAVCLNSATAAMELTLRILGVGPGDEVITTAYTYTASASVIDHVGAKIVMVDVAKDSFEMDYTKLADAITDKTKVIISVDLAGKMCDYDAISEVVANKRDLYKANNELQQKINRIVVMADAAIVYAYPNLIDYFINYFSDQEKLNTDVGLHFIGSQQPKANIPFWWYIDNLDLENSTLNPKEKDKVKARMERFSDIDVVKSKIHRSNQIEVTSFLEIEELGLMTIKKKTDIITYNIDVLDKKEVLDYILTELTMLKDNNEFKVDTPLRRLCLVYDIKHIHCTN